MSKVAILTSFQLETFQQIFRLENLSHHIDDSDIVRRTEYDSVPSPMFQIDFKYQLAVLLSLINAESWEINLRPI